MPFTLHGMFVFLIFVYRMSFPVTMNSHSNSLYTTMPPMITSPMQLDSTNAAGASVATTTTLNPERSLQLAKNDVQASLSQHESQLPKSHSRGISEIERNSVFDEEKFNALQSQTQQLSDHLTDFELAWTPRSSGDDGVPLLTFSDEFSENDNEWV
jgi:hypothetical protein